MNTRRPHLADRKEAEVSLATRLQRFQEILRTLVLALPRGGVEVGFMISKQLKLPLDAFLAGKLAYHGHSEYARGRLPKRNIHG